LQRYLILDIAGSKKKQPKYWHVNMALPKFAVRLFIRMSKIACSFLLLLQKNRGTRSVTSSTKLNEPKNRGRRKPDELASFASKSRPEPNQRRARRSQKTTASVFRHLRMAIYRSKKQSAVRSFSGFSIAQNSF